MDSEDTFDDTLDDDNWKDSFDRLLNKRSLLREQNIIKNKVRASFNNDSSVEDSIDNIPTRHPNEQNTLSARTSRSISTPKVVHHAYGPFDCPISPISAWRFTNFQQKSAWDSSCKLKSTILERVTESIEDGSLSCAKSLSRQQIVFTPSSLKRQSRISRLPKITITDEDKSDKSQSIIIEEQNTHASILAAMDCDQINSQSNIQNEGTGIALENSIGAQSHISATIHEHVNESVILPAGKWRRSLIIWKRLRQPKYECLDSTTDHKPFATSCILGNSRRTFSLNQGTNLQVCSKRQKQLDVLKICKQSTVLPFSSIYSNTGLRKCRKIGEGTYGEVFLNTVASEQTVIKIIPIEGDLNVNGEPQKTYETILPEILITSELSKLRDAKSFSTSGFVFLKNVRCVRGKYPKHLIELWDLYEQNYGTENDHPEIFKDDQVYIALEIAFGGKDLEGFVFRNSEQAYSAFLQVALSLAVAEKILEFEHRDLHCGNILIQPTNEKTIEYIIDKKEVLVPSNGIEVTIIDYTLSRMLLNKFSYYNDLSVDEELFCAKGDYQYEIYRMMREKLSNNWQIYDPKTNVMWLHYVLTKLLDSTKYKNSKSKQHKIFLERLKALRDTMMVYNSAYEFSKTIKL